MRRPHRRSFADEPLVSPYITLTNPAAQPGLNYFLFTSPLLRQQEINRQQTAGLQGLQYQLSAAKAGPYGFRGIGPTGHHATYMNFSHYYGGEVAGGGAGGGFQRRQAGGASQFGGGFGGGAGGMGMMGGMGMGMW